MTVAAGTSVHVRGGLTRVKVTLEGSTPLLQNRMSPEQLLNIRNKVKAPKSSSPIPPREEAETKVHRNADGKPIIPVHMLMSCLINAGQHVRLDGKRQISSAKSTVLPGLMGIDTKEIAITPNDFEVDVQQGRNPNGGEAVCIVRPRFDVWGLSLDIWVDLRQISMDKIRELFDIAGSRIGLGDFRPQRKGIYGQFRVVEWKQIKTADTE